MAGDIAGGYRGPTRRAVLAGSAAMAAAGMPAPALAQSETVSLGIVNSVTDVGFMVADKRGYFREEGLAVKFIEFDSAARMIAPMASGELNVASGGVSAGLYNAVARGLGIKIVAGKNQTPPGRSSQKLLMRRDFIDSGRYKTLADLKGMKFRVQQAKLPMDMVTALGASPTPMATGDVYSAIQTHVIDGAENNWPSYISFSHYEVARYFTVDGHMRVPTYGPG